jgi:ABC-type lipoprotein release transport system permease subunit
MFCRAGRAPADPFLDLQALLGATAALCMRVAASVAWRATRIRPIEVLRYE